MTDEKTCTKCGEAWPLSCFSPDKRRLDGLQSHCRACKSVYGAKWRSANKGYFDAYRQVNAKRQAAYKAARYAANPDRAKSYNDAWRMNNLERGRIREHSRRASKRATGGKLSVGLSDRLFKLQRGKCACCGDPLGANFHMDHIMPLALGGTNTDDNIQLLTATCNLKKHAKHPVDFMQSRGFLL